MTTRTETYPHDRMIDYIDFDGKIPETQSYDRYERIGIRILERIAYDDKSDAWVAELADALDLGSSTERCEGSTPSSRIPDESRTSLICSFFSERLTKFRDSDDCGSIIRRIL